MFREFVVAKELAEEQFDRDVRLAWHIEVLQRQRKLPPLKQLLIAQSRKGPQTEHERRAAIDDFRGLHGLTSKRVRLVKRDMVH